MKLSLELSKKQIGIFTLVLASLTSLSPFAIDTYVPAMPQMASFLGVMLSDIELSLSIYIIGYALGQFFGGPLSDSFGRRPIVVTGLSVFIITSYFLSVSDSLLQLYVLRFIQAFGGGFSVVVAMAIARDLFTGTILAKRITYISMVMMTAPLVAPAVGTLLLKLFGWQAIFSFLTIYGILVFILIVVFIPETRKSSSKKGIIINTAKNYILVFSNTKAMSYILASSLGFSGMFTFITGSSKIYIDHFNIPVELFPILFGSNVLLMIGMGAVNARIVTRISPKKILRAGLIIQLIAGALLSSLVFTNNAPFVVVFSLIVIFVGILGVVSSNANALALHMFPNISGVATAVIGVSLYAMGGFTGFLLNIFSNDTIFPITLIMFLCSLGANVLFRILNRM